MIVSPPFVLYVGYDRTLPPITLRCGGVAMNLSGMLIRGTFYPRAQGMGEPLTIENGRITLDPDPLTGTISEVWIPASLTADAVRGARSPATTPRVVLDLVDARRRTRPAIIIPFDVQTVRAAE